LIESTDSRVRSFGTLFAVIGVVIIPAFVFWKRGMWTDTASISAAIGVAFYLGGRFAPSALRPLFIAWMKLAMIMNFIMTRVIISLVFLLIMTPIGVVRRLSGSSTPKSFHRFRDPSTETYWIRRDSDRKPADSYFRQY
jgi:Zn-dependent protease with chaperone function